MKRNVTLALAAVDLALELRKRQIEAKRRRVTAEQWRMLEACASEYQRLAKIAFLAMPSSADIGECIGTLLWINHQALSLALRDNLPGEIYAADNDPNADPRAAQIMAGLRRAANR